MCPSDIVLNVGLRRICLTTIMINGDLSEVFQRLAVTYCNCTVIALFWCLIKFTTTTTTMWI